VFGRTAGVAPGLIADLEWGRLALHSESEYVFDLGDLTASFFYSWSQAGVQILDHLQAGVVVQRTKVFKTPRVVAVGPWVGVSWWKLDAGVYFFDPFDATRFVVASIGATF
jgi:hypothetical protein